MVDDELYSDSYALLMSSSRVRDDVKDLLKEKLFLIQNPDIIIHLARLLFLSDSIEVEQNEIVARKKVSIEKEPDIPVKKAINLYLNKIKYDTLSPKDLKKINELQKYLSYNRLYKAISEAIEQKNKIKNIEYIDDIDTIEKLEMFLQNE